MPRDRLPLNLPAPLKEAPIPYATRTRLCMLRKLRRVAAARPAEVLFSGQESWCTCVDAAADSGLRLLATGAGRTAAVKPAEMSPPLARSLPLTAVPLRLAATASRA